VSFNAFIQLFSIVEKNHEINNQSVDVKKVINKQDNKPMMGGRMTKGYGGGHGGGYSKYQ
jgi:hypothetical protein